MSEWAARAGLAAFKALGRLPVPVIRALATPLAAIIYRLANHRRHVARTNLRLCFPQWTDTERERVARAHFRAYLVTIFERFIFWFGPIERINALCSLEGKEHVEAHRGKPMIILAPHFVGLDAGGIRLQSEMRVDSMYAQQKSGTLTKAMTEGRSRFHGSRMILRNEGIRGAVRTLREGVPFYFLPDMDLGARDAVFVPFFGVPAATVTSVARLAKMTHAVIVPCVTLLTERGYAARFYPPWEDFPGDDIEAATRRMNAFIEERVLEAPEQYLWSHKRFKSRPEGEQGFY